MSKQKEVGQISKQSAMDLLGWETAADVPEVNRARMYYNETDNTVHAIDSDGNELLLGDGTAMSLFPNADQVVSGSFGLIFSPGGYVQVSPVSFADLPTASSDLEGTLRPINDANTDTWGDTITGTGAFHVLAYCDGSAWTVCGK